MYKKTYDTEIVDDEFTKPTPQIHKTKLIVTNPEVIKKTGKHDRTISIDERIIQLGLEETSQQEQPNFFTSDPNKISIIPTE